MKEENFKPIVKIHAEHTFGDDGPEAVDIEAGGAVIIGLNDLDKHYDADVYALGEVDYRAVVVSLIHGMKDALGPQKTAILAAMAVREAEQIAREAQA